jgi:hypothetical protein
MVDPRHTTARSSGTTPFNRDGTQKPSPHGGSDAT